MEQQTPTPASRIRALRCRDVNRSAPLFAELERDYDFALWWDATALDRVALVAGPAVDPEGVAILKLEEAPYSHLPGPVGKICTFTVAPAARRQGCGTRLLAEASHSLRLRGAGAVYMEVLPQKVELLTWLEARGFSPLPGAASRNGELVVVSTG